MCGFVMTRRKKGLYDVTLCALQRLIYSDIPDFGVLMTSHPLYVWFCYDAEKKRLIWRYAMCITKTDLFRHSWLWSAYDIYILCLSGFVMTRIEKGLYDIRRYSLRKLVYWDFSNSVVLMTFMFSNFCYDGDWQQCLYDDKMQLRQTSNSITYC